VNTVTQVLNNSLTPQISDRLSKNFTRHLKERVIEFILMLAAFSAVLTTAAIMGILLYESYGFFEHVSVTAFLTDTVWTPLFENPRYGILPLVSGTLTVTGVALVIAVPIGTISAIYLSEFASHRVRETVKPILELLAGVPTIVFGFFCTAVYHTSFTKNHARLANF